MGSGIILLSFEHVLRAQRVSMVKKNILATNTWSNDSFVTLRTVQRELQLDMRRLQPSTSKCDKEHNSGLFINQPLPKIVTAHYSERLWIAIWLNQGVVRYHADCTKRPTT